MGTVKRGVLNVIRNPIRMVIVVLLLGLCLMFVAAMVAMNASVQDRLTQIRGQVGTNMTISPAGSFGPFGGSGGSTSTLTDAQVTQIENTPGVVKTEPTVTQFYTGSELKSATSTTGTGDNGGGGGTFGGGGGRFFRSGPIVYGADALGDVSFFGGSTPTLASGRDLAASDANADVALMSQAMAQANNLSLNQTFTLQSTTITLVGMYTTGTRFADNSVLLPVKTAERLFSLTGVTSVTAYADSLNDVASVASKLESELGSGVSVVTQQDIINNTTSALDGTQKSIEGTLIASVVVAALVIIFAVFLIVRERNQEIGILKAIGASNLRVIGQFAAEILTFSVIAAVVAAVLLVVFGQPLASIFSIVSTGGGGGRGGFGGGGSGGFIRFAGGLGGGGGRFGNPLNSPLTPESLLILLGLGIVLAVLASVVPAWYVARLKPARVLRQAAA
ncbi:MAG TPA: FtsX-like permease family protein [Ktedonobacterales bacterium]|nr:FtsX-like permease family protein [Ktedonobacterales bacterium]